MSFKIVSIRVGGKRTLKHQGNEYLTGVNKRQLFEPVFVDQRGIVGDFHGDRTKHGTPDKALLIYPHAHYGRWKKELNRTLPMGSFGENLILQSINEKNISIGDVMTCGELEIQVSQPRYPCWKIADHSGIADLLERVNLFSRTGFYARVIHPGVIDMDCSFSIKERPTPNHSVHLAYMAYLKNHRISVDIEELLNNPFLSEEWKEMIKKEDLSC
jgi:MOSC domain-containing protein YiiM